MRVKMESKKGKSAVCWIYQYSKKSLWLVILLALISGAIAGSFILLALVSSSLLDVATGVKEGRLGVQIFLIVCLILLQAVLNILSSNVRIHATTKIEMQIRQGIFAAVLKKQYQHVSKIHSGEILNRLTSDIDIVVGAVVGLIPQAISMITKIVAGLAVLFSIDARFTAAVLGIGILVCIFSRIYSRHFKYLHKEVQRTNGVVRSYMQECIENLIVIKSFANEHAVCGKLNQFQKDNYRIRIKRNAISNLANTLVYVLFTAGYYAALVWGAFQISFGVMTFGTLTAFLQIIQQIRAPFRNVSGLIPQYYSMQASAERLMEIEDMEEERKINENTGNMLKQALERRQTERLSSNFSYRMMERVHQEAEKQTKRKTRIGWAALLISALALVGLGVYVLTFYLEFNFADVMPQMNVRQDSSLFAFYVYIALLALVLLGLDYWLRKKYIWK